MYKLTKGSLSLIRTTKAECKELEKQGFVLVGEVDQNYNLIDKKKAK